MLSRAPGPPRAWRAKSAQRTWGHRSPTPSRRTVPRPSGVCAHSLCTPLGPPRPCSTASFSASEPSLSWLSTLSTFGKCSQVFFLLLLIVACPPRACFPQARGSDPTESISPTTGVKQYCEPDIGLDTAPSGTELLIDPVYACTNALYRFHTCGGGSSSGWTFSSREKFL